MPNTPSPLPAQDPSDQHTAWELALDKPGSANNAQVRSSRLALLALLALTFLVLVFGATPLGEFPQFTTFHATFVLLVDANAAFLLLGQFRYRRLPLYLALSCSYLFSALLALPFMLTFPGALLPQGSVIGGMQSAIWVWHFWHLGFPAGILLALAVHQRHGDTRIATGAARRHIAMALTVTVLLVVAATLAATVLHNQLPRLLDTTRHPGGVAFYLAGGSAGLLTCVAMLLCWRLARQKTILFVWLTVVLAAFLTDILASLAAFPRYSLGWYGGRIAAMLAAGILLPVFVRELNLLYLHIAAVIRQLSAANRELEAHVHREKQLVAALEQREEHIRQLAFHDELTDLPNRRLLMDGVQQALAQAHHFQRALAVMFIDLNRFKHINDTLGHEVGDGVLQEVATRLRASVRSADTVCRLGGDEFVIVLAEIQAQQDAILVADKILASLRMPAMIHGHDLALAASIGIAVYPQVAAEDAQTLLTQADKAMYVAKQSGLPGYFLAPPQQSER